MDFGLIGTLQVLALLYGPHSVWETRPVGIAFEVDRLVLATANEVQIQELPEAPAGMRQLPWWGMLSMNTRVPKDGAEILQSVELGLAGISPTMRPSCWLPWSTAQAAIAARAKPLATLLQRRPYSAATLQSAVAKTRLTEQELYYLPLTSSTTQEWVALLDARQRIVGFVPVDGF